MHFFDAPTSKSGPKLRCFVYFQLDMCFAPQRRTTFHLLWLCPRRFSEPTFWPSGATDHWGNTMCRDFPIFSRTWIFFLRRLSPFDLLSSSLLFSNSSHLCFSSCPYCQKSLASKLPSANIHIQKITDTCSETYSNEYTYAYLQRDTHTHIYIYKIYQ